MLSQYYSALKLELTFRALVHVLGATDHWCTAEWGKEAGMYHLHCLMWIPGSVALALPNEEDRAEDCVRAESMFAPQERPVNVLWGPGESEPVYEYAAEDTDAPLPFGANLERDADRDNDQTGDKRSITQKSVAKVASYYEGLVCEWHPNKDTGRDDDGDPSSDFYRVGTRRDRARHGVKRQHLPCVTTTTTHDELRALCARRPDESDQEVFDRRANWLGGLVECVQMHDYHDPLPSGAPSMHQTCCKIEKGTEGTNNPKTYCSRSLPRRQALWRGEERVEQDPYRRSLYRIWLQRNCAYIVPFLPIASFLTQTNNDASPVLSKGGLVDYVCKYVTALKTTGLSASSATKAAYNIWDEAVRYAEQQDKGITSAIAKFFNAKAAPAFITAPEVHEGRKRGGELHRVSAVPRGVREESSM